MTEVVPHSRPSGQVAAGDDRAAGRRDRSPSPRGQVEPVPPGPRPPAARGRRTGGRPRTWARSRGPSARWRGHRGGRDQRVACRVGQQVRARGEVPGRGPDAVPGSAVAAASRLGADQIERVVGGERGRVIGEFLEHARAVGGGAQRQLAPAAAAGRVGLRAPGRSAGRPPGGRRDGPPARCRPPARRCPPTSGEPGQCRAGGSHGRSDELVAVRRAAGAASARPAQS